MRKLFAIFVMLIALAGGAAAQTKVNGARGVPVTNEGVTGTTLNKLVKLTGANTAVLAATTDTSGIIGICLDGCGTTGQADISRLGIAACVFDGGITQNDYVQISATTAGDCHDSGAAYPTSGELIGRVFSPTNASAGTYLVLLNGGEVQATTGGGGGVSTFSAGNLVPLFSSSVANPTTTPALSFALSNAAGHTFFGNNTGTTGAPGYVAIGAGDLPATTVNSVGGLSPLFTSSIAAQALSFTLSNAAAHTFFGNNTGSLGAPAFGAIGTADLPGSGGTTVNGTSCVLGSTCTVTANNPNAVTFNNSGSGAASGSTYNGGAAVTISYNTVGAAASNAATTVNGATCTLGSTCAPYGGVNTFTTSHTVASTDIGKLIVMNCASACTLTFSATPASTDWFGAMTIGSTVATISLNTKNFNGAASVPALNSFRDLRVWSDGTNYFGDAPIVQGANIVLTPASNGFTIAASASSGMTNPMTTLGDTIYENATPAAARLAGPTTPNGVPQFLIETPSGGVAQAPAWALSGVGGRTVTTTSDTIAATDRTNWVVYNSGSAVGTSLGSAASFGSNFAFGIKNVGAGAVTITPTTSTIDGNATLVVSQGQNCTITSLDNTNYVSRCASGQMVAGTGVTFTPSASGLTINASGTPLTTQTNGTNNLSQTALNLQNSGATNGITLTVTNASAGNVQLGWTGTLSATGGGTGCNTGAGSVGQIPISDGTKLCPADPIVSYNYVNLFNAQAATGTATSSVVRVSTFGASGTLYFTYAGITGSPSGCTLQIQNVDSLGNVINNGGAATLSPANGTVSLTFNAGTNLGTTPQMKAVYACSVYPSTGTLSVDYSPGVATWLVGPLPAGTQIIGSVNINGTPTVTANQGTANTHANGWFVKITDGTHDANVDTNGDLNIDNQQIGGSAIATSAAGVQKVGIVGSTAGVLDAAGQNVAAPANWLAIGCQFNTAPSTITSGNGSPIQCDNVGDQLVKIINATLAVTQSGAPWTILGTLGDNGNAATTNRLPILAGIARNDYAGGTAKTAGNNAAPDVGTDGLLHTASLPDLSLKRYRAASKFAASSTTDNWRISGNASNTVVVTKIALTCTQTTAGMVSVELKKESAAETGGTSASVTAVPLDSGKAAASSVVNSYTGTGPTVGANVGDIDDAQVGCMASGTAAPNDIYIAPTSPGAPVAVLRGVAEGLAINLGGAVTGGNITVTVEWEEVTTILP